MRNQHFQQTCHLVKQRKERMEQAPSATTQVTFHKQQSSQRGQDSRRFWDKLKRAGSSMKTKTTEVDGNESDEQREARQQVWWRQFLISNAAQTYAFNVSSNAKR
ncbi:hypothetical protein P43SY_003946 [Pythium insidiosum]|uniref:Uncharacterized protein n=1 Tax=Pythium insidiosum TaxID=114742 RepID=A0AAD5M0N8_PYTIN|nr:hypothetical protein P43SY_003946 [Pythium insidiosum]